MVRKVNYSYVFKEESVTVFRNNDRLGQYISFNCYSLQSRKKFYQFREKLQNSKQGEFDDINDIYHLARIYEIRASHGHKPTFVDDKIAF
jgi:hypothetical protein